MSKRIPPILDNWPKDPGVRSLARILGQPADHANVRATLLELAQLIGTGTDLLTPTELVPWLKSHTAEPDEVVSARTLQRWARLGQVQCEPHLRIRLLPLRQFLPHDNQENPGHG